MRTRKRALATAAALVALLVTTAAPALAEELSPTGERAMAQIAGCAASADRLLVSVVVDESGSLRETDPTDERVAGINSAIDVLEDLRERAGGALDVQVNLALFAEEYTELTPWLTLDAANADRVRSVSSAELPTRDRGLFTDYRAALNGAKASLNEREAALDGQSCKVLLWFTDGALDVQDQTARALKDLCAPNGIADSLRSSQISVVALALFNEKGTVTPAQREELRAVAESRGEGITCGQSPVPSDQAAGAYLRADDASALRRVFAGVGALISGASQSQALECPSDACVDGSLPFPVDRGIAGLQLIVDSPEDTAVLELTSPGGAPIALSEGSSPQAWGQLDVGARGGLTIATVTFDAVEGPHVGSWTLRALDSSGEPSPVMVDLYYFWGASLVVDAPDGIIVGEASDLRVELRVAGQTVAPDWYSSLDVGLRVAGETVALTADGDHLVGSVTLPSDGVPSELTATATAVASTSPSNLRLAPVSASAVLATRLPASFPTLSPTRLSVSEISGSEGGTGTLTVTGSDRGPTTACFEGHTLTGPELAGNITAAPTEQCIEIPAGESVDWLFTLTADELADGQIAGDLELLLTGADEGDAVTVSVPVSSSMTRPVDEPLRWALVAGLVALSLLVPLLLLAIGNWWVGRFRLTHLSRAAVVPVIVTPQGVRRRGEGGALIGPDDFSAVGEGEVRKRAFSVHGVRFSHALPWWPLGEPTASASGAPGELVASGTGTYTDSEAGRAPVTSALAQSWVLLVDPDTITDDQATGRLVFVNEDTGLREVIEARSARFDSFPGWDIVWTKIRAAATKRAVATSPTDGGGRSSMPAPGAAPSTGAPVSTDLASEPGPLDGPPSAFSWDDDGGTPPPGVPYGRVPTTEETSAGRRSWRRTAKPSPSERAGRRSPRVEETSTEPDVRRDDDLPPPPPISF